ncbi:hypothetical protein B0H19DRAFT_1275189 [Mycena capillaripes]|nr:hypothetical protein B0H19DRAFT_1275189 [Mycena capillaripes]
MKFIIALLVPFIAAVAVAAEPIAKRAAALDARAPQVTPPHCSVQLCCGGVGTPEAAECSVLGYICHAQTPFEAPVLGLGGTPYATCTTDCVWTLDQHSIRFEHDPHRPKAEPEPSVQFKPAFNLEPELDIHTIAPAALPSADMEVPHSRANTELINGLSSESSRDAHIILLYCHELRVSLRDLLL